MIGKVTWVVGKIPMSDEKILCVGKNHHQHMAIFSKQNTDVVDKSGNDHVDIVGFCGITITKWANKWVTELVSGWG